MTGRWVNRDAVEWVFYDADVGADQCFVLAAVASFMDADGRGAHPARSLVAQMTRRSVRQVHRDLTDLLKQGQLQPGDWRKVMHIRPDRRPRVYDLPDAYRAWLSRGVNMSPRDVSRGDTTSPRKPATGGHQRPNGVTSATERGDTMSPEEVLKTSGTASADAQPSAASSPAEENPAGTVAADQAKAELREKLAGRPRPNLSHWRVGTAPDGQPNPHYDPAAAARLAAENNGGDP